MAICMVILHYTAPAYCQETLLCHFSSNPTLQLQIAYYCLKINTRIKLVNNKTTIGLLND